MIRLLRPAWTILLLLAVTSLGFSQTTLPSLLQVKPLAPLALARPTSVQQPSGAALLAGGFLGGAAGLVAGGLMGGVIGGNSCTEPGNPESCHGFEGVVAGGTLGISVGIPVGVHLANDKRGKLLTALAISVAMPGLVHLLARSTGDDRFYAGLLATPFAQFATSTLIELRGRR